MLVNYKTAVMLNIVMIYLFYYLSKTSCIFSFFVYKFFDNGEIYIRIFVDMLILYIFIYFKFVEHLQFMNNIDKYIITVIRKNILFNFI